MAYEEFRLLAAAVLLERFTAGELTAAARTNQNTTRSWLGRQREFLDSERGTIGGRGRPQKVYSLKPSAAEAMRRRLNEFRQHTDHAAERGEQRRLLDDVERDFRHWRTFATSTATGSGPHLTTLRLAIRMAWQEFARLEAFGVAIDSGHLRQLAQIEFEAGLVAPPSEKGLQHIALWLGGRLTRLSKQNVEESFAVRAMWVRAESRNELDRRCITAAALGAPVWSDEGLATAEVDMASLVLCRRIAELTPVNTRLSHASRAIRDNGASLCLDDGEAQAVVRGITACSDAREAAIRDWLVAARMRGDWRPALAPMVVHGLLKADDLILPRVMHELRDALAETLNNFNGKKGRLRAEAFDYGRRALDATSVGKLADSEIPSLARRFGSDSVLFSTQP